VCSRALCTSQWCGTSSAGCAQSGPLGKSAAASKQRQQHVERQHIAHCSSTQGTLHHKQPWEGVGWLLSRLAVATLWTVKSLGITA
jgi:hypothetical protein